MLNSLKQVRGAVGLLNPEEVRRRASQPLRIGLAAPSEHAYREMEEFVAPANGGQVFRTDSPGAPEDFDLVLYYPGPALPRGVFRFRPEAPQETAAEAVSALDELGLPLANQFPAFRKAAVNRMVREVAKENAFFTIATALPNIVPNLIELPWALGEFAGDTAFLTMNQVRLAFLVAGACGREVGFREQKREIVSIAAGAFGWRAIARELAGKIPLGGGLIPKGAIAWAGTYVVGKGLEFYHHAGVMPNKAQRQAMYHQAYQEGKEVVAAEVKNRKS